MYQIQTHYDLRKTLFQNTSKEGKKINKQIHNLIKDWGQGTYTAQYFQDHKNAVQLYEAIGQSGAQVRQTP